MVGVGGSSPLAPTIEPQDVTRFGTKPKPFIEMSFTKAIAVVVLAVAVTGTP